MLYSALLRGALVGIVEKQNKLFELFFIHSFASSQFGPFGKIKGVGFVQLLRLIQFVLLQILLAGKQGFLIALQDAVGEV